VWLLEQDVRDWKFNLCDVVVDSKFNDEWECVHGQLKSGCGEDVARVFVKYNQLWSGRLKSHEHCEISQLQRR